jgi:hypothetical protein
MKLISSLIGYKAYFIKTISEEAWIIYTLPEGVDLIITGPYR